MLESLEARSLRGRKWAPGGVSWKVITVHLPSDSFRLPSPGFFFCHDPQNYRAGWWIKLSETLSQVSNLLLLAILSCVLATARRKMTNTRRLDAFCHTLSSLWNGWVGSFHTHLAAVRLELRQRDNQLLSPFSFYHLSSPLLMTETM
jgi:hypothetical protein